MNGLAKRIAITLGILSLPLIVGLLFTYEKVKVDWISFMEIQPSYRPMEDPLPVPADSVPIEGPAYVKGVGSPVNPVEADAVSLERGKILYNIHCALCHGEDGKGQGPIAPFLRQHPPADLTSAVVKEDSDGAIFLVITNGVEGAMPALRENLTVRERWDVVNYLRTLQTP